MGSLLAGFAPFECFLSTPFFLSLSLFLTVPASLCVRVVARFCDFSFVLVLSSKERTFVNLSICTFLLKNPFLVAYVDRE